VVAARVNRDRVITSITENITESMKIGHFSIVTNAIWFVEGLNRVSQPER